MTARSGLRARARAQRSGQAPVAARFGAGPRCLQVLARRPLSSDDPFCSDCLAAAWLASLDAGPRPTWREIALGIPLHAHRLAASARSQTNLSFVAATADIC